MKEKGVGSEIEKKFKNENFRLQTKIKGRFFSRPFFALHFLFEGALFFFDESFFFFHPLIFTLIFSKEKKERELFLRPFSLKGVIFLSPSPTLFLLTAPFFFSEGRFTKAPFFQPSSFFSPFLLYSLLTLCNYIFNFLTL